MGKIVGFQNEHDARRVVRATKRIETPDISGRDGGRYEHHANVITAKITGDNGDDDSPKYSWEQVRLIDDGTDAETVPDGLTGTTSVNYAVSLSGEEFGSGDYVTLVRIVVDNDDGSYDMAWSAFGGGKKGTLKYQVCQMVTDKKVGFDWVRFH